MVYNGKSFLEMYDLGVSQQETSIGTLGRMTQRVTLCLQHLPIRAQLFSTGNSGWYPCFLKLKQAAMQTMHWLQASCGLPKLVGLKPESSMHCHYTLNLPVESQPPRELRQRAYSWHWDSTKDEHFLSMEKTWPFQEMSDIVLKCPKLPNLSRIIN